MQFDSHPRLHRVLAIAQDRVLAFSRLYHKETALQSGFFTCASRMSEYIAGDPGGGECPSVVAIDYRRYRGDIK